MNAIVDHDGRVRQMPKTAARVDSLYALVVKLLEVLDIRAEVCVKRLVERLVNPAASILR